MRCSRWAADTTCFATDQSPAPWMRHRKAEQISGHQRRPRSSCTCYTCPGLCYSLLAAGTTCFSTDQSPAPWTRFEAGQIFGHRGPPRSWSTFVNPCRSLLATGTTCFATDQSPAPWMRLYDKAGQRSARRGPPRSCGTSTKPCRSLLAVDTTCCATDQSLAPCSLTSWAERRFGRRGPSHSSRTCTDWGNNRSLQVEGRTSSAADQ